MERKGGEMGLKWQNNERVVCVCVCACVCVCMYVLVRVCVCCSQHNRDAVTPLHSCEYAHTLLSLLQASITYIIIFDMQKDKNSSIINQTACTVNRLAFVTIQTELKLAWLLVIL